MARAIRTKGAIRAGGPDTIPTITTGQYHHQTMDNAGDIYKSLDPFYPTTITNFILYVFTQITFFARPSV